MANICSTDYAFYSKNSEELKEFHRILQNAVNDVQSGRVPSESGEADYEVLQLAIGISRLELVPGRGYICSMDDDVQNDEEGEFFIVQMCDMWRASPDIFRKMLHDFPDIQFVYQEIEPGNGIAETNDRNGRFFRDDGENHLTIV